MVLLQIFVFVSVIVIPAAAVARSTPQTPAASPEPAPSEPSTDATRGGKAVAPPVEEPSATPKPKPKPTTTRSTPKVAPKATVEKTKPSTSRGETKKTTTLTPKTETPAVTTAAVGEPTIVSDQADYPPGATVTLTGENWAADEVVHIYVNDTLGSSWSRNVDVTASAAGQIVDVFDLPTWFVSSYNVVATGPVSGTATTTFTDLSIGTYDQCSNDDGDGFGGDPGTCNWINGNLQSNNSTYHEGDATVQRLWLKDFVPGSHHSVTLKYGTTKSGTHAYDFLTTWDWSEDWITLANRCETITGCQTAAEDTEFIPGDSNVPNAIETGLGTASRQFVMRGGTISGVSSPALVSGTYGGGDSETALTIEFDVAATGSMCLTQGQSTTCGIALWFGAHIAESDPWEAVDGFGGATNIPGSPYHVSLDAVDDASAGERDNQMQAGQGCRPR
jgi:hypothetical protein